MGGVPALDNFKRFRRQPKLLAVFFQSLERLTYFLPVTKVGINERSKHTPRSPRWL